MRTYASLDFKSNLSEAELAQFSRNVIARVKDNPRFAALQSPLLDPELLQTSERYHTALLEAADRSRVKTAEKRQARRALLHALDRLANQLTLSADGDESAILEAGFQVRRRGQKGEKELRSVASLRVRQGSRPGEVVLDYSPVPHVLVYAAEWSTDGGEHWQNGVYSASRRAVVSDLPVRQEIWFRIFSIGRQQRKSAPCGAVSLFVL